jgi:flagellar hook assembly protein FlgD
VTGEVTVKIYSVLGEEVRALHSGVLERGMHWLKWDGRNNAGRAVATGMYLTRMTTSAGGSHVIKMLLMK